MKPSIESDYMYYILSSLTLLFLIVYPVGYTVMDLRDDFIDVDLQEMKCVTDLLRLDFKQTS